MDEFQDFLFIMYWPVYGWPFMLLFITITFAEYLQRSGQVLRPFKNGIIWASLICLTPGLFFWLYYLIKYMPYTTLQSSIEQDLSFHFGTFVIGTLIPLAMSSLAIFLMVRSWKRIEVPTRLKVYGLAIGHSVFSYLVFMIFFAGVYFIISALHE